MKVLPIIETAAGFFMKPSGRSTEELLTAKIAEKAAEDAEKRAGIFPVRLSSSPMDFSPFLR
jgi:hypothetical protein